MNWIGGILAGAIATTLVAWFGGLLNQTLPSPQWLRLALKNQLRVVRQPSDDKFRIVLCWLENDYKGEDATNVEATFSGVDGITLVRSETTVSASGAGDDWRDSMQQKAREVLKREKADLAIAGTVKKPGDVLSLWFVPRTGDGTLDRGDQPYVLEDVTLGKDFHDDLQAQLTAMALTAISPLADTAVLGKVLTKELRVATDKLSKLTESAAGRRPEHQAAMEAGLATSLVALSRRERKTESLERAVAAYRGALKIFTRERMPSQWSLALNDLGVALVALAERETGTERLKEAIAAYGAALEVRTRDRAPLDWALTQNNLGVALATIAERESSAERVEEAIAAYRAALEVRTRDWAPLDWGATKNNLGNALVRLYRLRGGNELLDASISGYRDALEERTRGRDLATHEKSTKHLKEAISAYRSPLCQHD